ncbi:peptidoglycan editing factor PgeF [Brevibacillus ruminantium]|uniref:Purine nucleoside phosphorylase n=1 Tax=Brevibacillus ruminantium TaxID=2950604 RepID=A0ABY4WLN3_9BACL|nr:peptidoglycan editing factor PgeF [Brevibacillus ruminantium]USG67574.1 peptidoglycan editing factor PgeF [Brevibacillus ruminantium]
MNEPFMEQTNAAGLRLQEWEKAFPGLVAGFTIRTGGVSAEPYGSFNMGLHVGDDDSHVVTNRRLLAESLEMSFDAWTCADQVHGNRVCEVTAGGAGKESLRDVIPATDGLFTNKEGVLLTSFYADCVPLYFLDPSSGAIGLAHAGWKGTVSRIAEEMINAFCDTYKTKTEQLCIAIGPSIGGCCYEVDDRVIQEVRKSAREWPHAVVSLKNGRYMLDLPRLNQEILEECGVAPENILRTGWCTSCRTDLFFSHRKEAGVTGKTGRMASFIGWRKR